MSFSINTNIASLQAQNYLSNSSQFQAHTINEVTSGLRIVNSGDDAAGLAVANGLRSDQAVLNQGIQNGNNGLATLQTVDSGMNNISTLLDRARTLATESASGTFTGDRSTLNGEFQSVIQEINRQAQSIGMNQGGQFAQNLSVFIGGGRGTTSAAASQNGSISLDLSKSSVDAQSLGLQGVQATGAAGTDIGSGSASTSVSQILSNTANSGSETVPGYTTFSISGPGFGDSGKVNLSVNLSGVTDTTTLAAAVNSAIQTAANGATQQATAFKNANITASVVTDAQGRQQLAFSSSTAAFQVQAGDKMANALLGNFAQNAKLEGSDTAANVGSTGLSFSSLQIDGNSVTLSAATQNALAGGGVATSGYVSGLATISDSAIAGASLANKTLTLSVDGNSQTVTFKGGETSLSQIASEITDANVGVTASITGSGSTQQLTLTSNTTGSSSAVNVTGGTITSMAGAATITGFTGSLNGQAGKSGAVTTSTSGSVTGSALTTASADAAVAAAFAANDVLALNVNGTQKTVTFTSAPTTLADVRDDINNAGIGVTASIKTSGSTEQLVLTSNDTGSASNVSVLVGGQTSIAGGVAAGMAALGFSGSADSVGTAGQDATAAPSKGAIVAALNQDASFSSVATASLDGNKVVIESKANGANSSVQASGTLATALGFSSTAATAASASTGADLKTTVQGAGTVGSIDQAVIGSLTAPTAATSASNDKLNISINGGTAVTLTLAHGNSTNAAVAADLNTKIAQSSLAGQVAASVDSNGKLELTATHANTTVTVGGAGSTTDNAAVNLGFAAGQTSGTSTDAMVTSSDNIQVKIMGGGMTSPVTISLNPTTAGTTKVSDVLADLTSQVAANSALAGAGISLSTNSIGNNLVFTNNKGENFQVAVTGDTNNILGFGSFAAGGGNSFDYSSATASTTLPTGAPVTNTASTGTLNISLNGGQSQAINVSLKSTSGSVSGTATNDNAISAAAIGGKTVKFSIDGGAAQTVTFTAGDATLQDVVNDLNSGLTGAKADIVGTGSNQQIRITSSSTGTTSSVSVVTGGSATAGQMTALGLSIGQSGSGLADASAVQADAVNQINAAIASNSTLSGAGLQASIVSNKLVLTSSNGTAFRVNGSGATDLGFGKTGASYAGTTNSGSPAVGRSDAQGAFTSSSMKFTGIANGGDVQTISITATDPSGGTHSQAITLQNNTTARTGDNIDDAIHAINSSLQQSNDSTLQSIYAVKETNSDGSESIKFQSTTQNFKIGVSSMSDGTGLSAPAGGLSTSAANGAGANVSIDTIAGAQAAVNALANAVQNLGTAQAAVGKGENLLNYAISLATSQTTNEAAAESQIRDANLAQEAANLSRAQILVQAGTAALAQANSAPQQLLSLLKG